MLTKRYASFIFFCLGVREQKKVENHCYTRFSERPRIWFYVHYVGEPREDRMREDKAVVLSLFKLVAHFGSQIQ